MYFAQIKLRELMAFITLADNRLKKRHLVYFSDIYAIAFGKNAMFFIFKVQCFNFPFP